MPEPATFKICACRYCGLLSPTALEDCIHQLTTHLGEDVGFEGKEREFEVWLLSRCRDWRSLPAMGMRFSRN